MQLKHFPRITSLLIDTRPKLILAYQFICKGQCPLYFSQQTKSCSLSAWGTGSPENLKRNIVGDWRFDSPSGSPHQSQGKSCLSVDGAKSLVFENDIS